MRYLCGRIEHISDVAVTAASILAGIHLVRIATQVQMIAFLNLLDIWLEAHPVVGQLALCLRADQLMGQVHLVIIDSLSYHFRQPNLDLSARRRIMDTWVISHLDKRNQLI